MRATLLHIISNPVIYAKLQREIDAAESNTRISNPVQDLEAKNLPYLQACIKEGLRIFPPITQLRERVTPSGGDTIDGRFIPGGTFIGINARGAQRNQDVYGSDADVFRPERWLRADQEKLKEMEMVHSLIFSYGNSKCLGIPIAMMNLNKIFVQVGSSIPCVAYRR